MLLLSCKLLLSFGFCVRLICESLEILMGNIQWKWNLAEEQRCQAFSTFLNQARGTFFHTNQNAHYRQALASSHNVD